MHSEYDDLGNEVYIEYFDTEEKLVSDKEYGYASQKIIYENGQSVERQYFNENGMLTLRKVGGYAVVRYKYDDYGKLIAKRYYGTDGTKLVMNTEDGYAGCEYRYDENGNCKDEYYSSNQEPVIRSGLGYAAIEMSYDNTDMIEKRYLGVGKVPIAATGNEYAQVLYIYDEYGDEVDNKYIDKAGKEVE